MISITRRSLTEDERRRLALALGERPPQGLTAWVACFLLLPVVWGGMVFALLSSLRVPRAAAVPLGLSLGFLLGLILFLRGRRRDTAALAADTASRRQDLRVGAVQVWDFEVRRAWEVRAAEGEGPGYLFQVDGDTLVYAASRDFAGWGTGRFPTRRVAVHRLPHSKSILAVTAAGDPLRVENTVVTASELPVRPSIQSDLIWRSGLLPSVQAKLWP